MACRAVFFDVGETLLDESGHWRDVASVVGLPEQVVLAALGVTIALGEPKSAVFERLGVAAPAAAEVSVPRREDLYPDALPCLLALRRAGVRVGICDNGTPSLEQWATTEQLPVDVVGSSSSWGAEKPGVQFFLRLVDAAGCSPAEIAYVGDRVDEDVVPAVELGLYAIHLRRGPWGYLQRGAERASARIESLAEVLIAIDRL